MLLVTSALLAAVSATPAVGPSGDGTPGVNRSQVSVTLRGYVSEVLSVRIVSHETSGGGVTGQVSGQGLQYTFDVGDVSNAAMRGQDVLGGTVTLSLRSNVRYVMSAQATAAGFIPDEGYVQLKDIEVGIPSEEIRASGAMARNSNTRLRSSFDRDPLAASVRPASDGALSSAADLVSAQQLLSGDAISVRGTLRSQANGLLVSTKYALRPALFRSQGPFAVSITYTLASP